MEFTRFCFLVFSVFLISYVFSVHGRFYDYPKVSRFRALSQISMPPFPAPAPGPGPAPAPEPKGDPKTENVKNSSNDYAAGIFNVLSYGAVGDGVIDDTQAFKMAWDTACQVDSAILLVPKHHSFMIQSTIFTGPCKSGLIFKVM